MREAETAVMCPKPSMAHSHQELRDRHELNAPSGPLVRTNLPAHRFLTSGLQNGENTFLLFEPPSL